MLRLASSKALSYSTVLPNALRAILSPPNILIRSSISTPQNPLPNHFPHNYFSTHSNKLSADLQLAKAINSEIESIKRAPRPPADFPFTIEDDPDESTLTLRRALSGEEILVSVAMPSYIPDKDEDDESYKCCGCGNTIPVDLHVEVAKKSGKKLDFGVSISTHGMYVNTMSVMEPAKDGDRSTLCHGPYDVDDVGCEIVSALREYIEKRGVRKSDALFLCKYMVKKSKRQRLAALEKLEKFVE